MSELKPKNLPTVKIKHKCKFCGRETTLLIQIWNFQAAVFEHEESRDGLQIKRVG